MCCALKVKKADDGLQWRTHGVGSELNNVHNVHGVPRDGGVPEKNLLNKLMCFLIFMIHRIFLINRMVP